jgi:hypothetical protein
MTTRSVCGTGLVIPSLTGFYSLFLVQRYRRRDPIEDWLIHLDMESDEVRRITDKNGTRAGKLYELFVVQTRSPMTLPMFGNEMKRMIEMSRGPFGPKQRDQNGCYYPCRVQP